MTMSNAEIAAHDILDPIVAEYVETVCADLDRVDEWLSAEQMPKWVSDAINNTYYEGVSGEALAAMVAAKFGLEIPT